MSMVKRERGKSSARSMEPAVTGGERNEFRVRVRGLEVCISGRVLLILALGILGALGVIAKINIP